MKKWLAVSVLAVWLCAGCAPAAPSGSVPISSHTGEASTAASDKTDASATTTTAQTSSTTAVDSGPNWQAASSNLTVLAPAHGSMTADASPTFEWKKLKGATSYSLKVEEYAEGTYTTVMDEKKLTGTSYKSRTSLKAGGVYRFQLTAQVNGQTKKAYNLPPDGGVFMNRVDSRNHPANKGLDFAFQGKVSEKVLNNYLSRAMVSSLLNDAYGAPAVAANNARMILNTGAKYIGRAYSIWLPDRTQEAQYPAIKRTIADVHAIDPDVVFEGCIFETAWSGLDSFPIPDWVFQAFGKPVESRNFSYKNMLFPGGKYLNQFGEGISCPDITQLETQMFIYYRARTMIDLGFEAFHMGQANLIGANDAGNREYAKVFSLIRQYAAGKARRGFVFINAHYPPKFDMKGPDGRFLLDFNALPSCLSTNPSDPPHLPSENNPQKAFIQVGNGIYKNSPGGVTPSGWQTDSLPYFVEFDNFMPEVTDIQAQLTKPGNGRFQPWGFDEISWFANQPSKYRRDFLRYMTETVRSFDKGGHFEMPGYRTAYLLSSKKQENYLAASRLFGDGGFDDEETIRQIWIDSRK